MTRHWLITSKQFLFIASVRCSLSLRHQMFIFYVYLVRVCVCVSVFFRCNSLARSLTESGRRAITISRANVLFTSVPNASANTPCVTITLYISDGVCLYVGNAFSALAASESTKHAKNCIHFSCFVCFVFFFILVLLLLLLNLVVFSIYHRVPIIAVVDDIVFSGFWTIKSMLCIIPPARPIALTRLCATYTKHPNNTMYGISIWCQWTWNVQPKVFVLCRSTVKSAFKAHINKMPFTISVVETVAHHPAIFHHSNAIYASKYFMVERAVHPEKKITAQDSTTKAHSTVIRAKWFH